MTTPVCGDELRKVYDAIMALASGRATTTVTFGDRSVTYSQSQLRELRGLYAVFYRTCGADSGLADLSAGAAVARGSPVTYRFY